MRVADDEVGGGEKVQLRFCLEACRTKETVRGILGIIQVNVLS